MSDSQRQLPPSDRAERPDPLPEEDALARVERLARRDHPKLMAEADKLAAKEAALRGKRRDAAASVATALTALTENSEAAAELSRSIDRLPPIVEREPGEDDDRR